jgi:hypothetical protein
VIAVSVGDVSTTWSKFLEPGGPAGRQEKQPSPGQQSQDPNRAGSALSWGQSQPHLSSLLRLVTWSYQQGTPCLDLVTLRNFTDNSVSRLFLGT